MGIMYIKDGNNVFELTATTDVAFSYRGSLTNYPVEDGFANTDHYTVENTTLTMQGVITEVLKLNNDSPTKGQKDYIEGLRNLQLSKKPFTVFLDDKLKPFKNCLFTSFDISRSQAEGTSGWRISLGIEQIRIEDKARASLIQVASTSETSDVNGTNDKTGSTSDVGTKPTKTELPRTILRGFSEGVESEFGTFVQPVTSGGTP